MQDKFQLDAFVAAANGSESHPVYPSDGHLLACLSRRAVLKVRGAFAASAGLSKGLESRKAHVIGNGGFGRVWRAAAPRGETGVSDLIRTAEAFADGRRHS